MKGETVRRFLFIVLAVLALVLIALLVRHDEETLADLKRFDLDSLSSKIIALVLLGVVALSLYRQRFMYALQSALIWLAIALVLVIGYTYRSELLQVADRVLAELIPGRAASRGDAVEVARGTGGSFTVIMRVNGARVTMVLDTGATAVVLTQDAAKAAGLPLELLSYTVSVDTANGRTRAAPVMLDRISIGGIVERKVPALIAQPGQLRTSLLGMSFLDRLASWEVRGDRLIMRGSPYTSVIQAN
jgi:aspartyl protease family protein